ncbi:hypothetical protein PHYPSEUDO_014793 [Phytophthora pseudosyringae]|uniref:Uncharacterized protein n=1 Tax=Phytophthora pseudosyringae TaxID=221518 RepID=A0A8T1V6I0_9STRA|nr:hypothetical protein PHYPSEUDO_014793 [Phytophthora pseudosyringae]
MLSTREARTATKTNELQTTSATRRSKTNDPDSLSARNQAWPASVDRRQKHTQGAVNGYSSITRTSSTTIDSVRGASSTHESPRADSPRNSDSDGESRGSSCYSSDGDESVSKLVNELNGEHARHAIDARKYVKTAVLAREATSKHLLGSSTISNSTELGEIQQSVQRLRAQRTHVERLSQRNDEFERQLAEQKAENETLQREVFTLRGAEQENVAYLQSVKLLERRSRALEEACNAKKLELRTTTQKLSCVEQERDQLRREMQNARQDHEDEVKVLRVKQKKLFERIEQLEQSHGTQTDDRKRMELHWKQKIQAAARANFQTVDSLKQQLEQNCNKTRKFEAEVRGLEDQVQNLLATTVRQTTVIEECDRVLSETKAQQQQTQRNYEEQLQLSCELSAKTQRLDVKLASLKQSKGLEAGELEKKVMLLENKLAKRKAQLKVANEALRNKDKEIEVIQRAYVTRDDNRLHLDEQVNKELQRREMKLKSEISELQIALRDATYETSLLSEQVVELQERLESERKDRSRWATARLKLLAEFCDEESKLSSALNHHCDVSFDERRSGHKHNSPRRKSKNRRATNSKASEDRSYDGDDSEKEDEHRRNSIVFG